MGILKLLLKDFSRWLFWYPLRWFLSILPIPIAYKIGDGMAWLVYKVNKRRREKTRAELLRMDMGRKLSEEEIEDIIKMGVMMFFWNQMDILLYPKLMKKPVGYYTELVGEENLKAALSKGKGVILAHPHLANAQMLMPALAFRGYPLNQVGLTPQDLIEEMDSESHIPESLQDVKKEIPDSQTKLGMPPPTPMLERVLELMHQLEISLPAKFVYLRQSLLPAFRCLKRNELLAIAIDGAGGKNRVFVNLLGRKASFSQGPVAIALREGATILPLYTIRLKPSYKHRIILDKPFELIKTDDSVKDVAVNTQRIADCISQFISQHPGQYARLLGYKRVFFAD